MELQHQIIDDIVVMHLEGALVGEQIQIALLALADDYLSQQKSRFVVDCSQLTAVKQHGLELSVGAAHQSPQRRWRGDSNRHPRCDEQPTHHLQAQRHFPNQAQRGRSTERMVGGRRRKQVGLLFFILKTKWSVQTCTDHFCSKEMLST